MSSFRGTALLALQRRSDAGIVPAVDAGADGLAPRRRGRDQRHGVQADQRQLQRARDRRRAQRQHVDSAVALQARLVGRAEALFLVDDDEPEPGIAHALGHHRAGADHDADRAIGKARLGRLLLRRARQAREARDGDAAFGEALAERLEVLARQHGCGRGHDDLVAGERGKRCGAQGDLGLPIAHVTHHQALHRLAAGKVVAHGGDRPRLVGRLVEGEPRHEALVGRRVRLERGRGQPAALVGQGDQAARALGDGLVDGTAPFRPALAIQPV
jgi:hypothetical protein